LTLKHHRFRRKKTKSSPETIWSFWMTVACLKVIKHPSDSDRLLRKITCHLSSISLPYLSIFNLFCNHNAVIKREIDSLLTISCCHPLQETVILRLQHSRSSDDSILLYCFEVLRLWESPDHICTSCSDLYGRKSSAFITRIVWLLLTPVSIWGQTNYSDHRLFPSSPPREYQNPNHPTTVCCIDYDWNLIFESCVHRKKAAAGQSEPSHYPGQTLAWQVE